MKKIRKRLRCAFLVLQFTYALQKVAHRPGGTGIPDRSNTMTKTYAAVQHGPQKISIDHLENGKYVSQVSMYFTSREQAKEELSRLCAADAVPAFSKYILSFAEVK